MKKTDKKEDKKTQKQEKKSVEEFEVISSSELIEKSIYKLNFVLNKELM